MPQPLRRAVERPVVTTAVLALVVGLLNVWWTHRNRGLGTFTVDEAGYIATSLRYHRTIDPLHPFAFVDQVFFPSATGPLVPLLSVPLLIVGSRSIDTVLATQALVVGVAAVASAGVVGRLAGKGAAVVSGIVVLGLPAMILSARFVQYAAALGACLLLALWALLASDRGHGRRAMLAFGAAIGAMLLARTMSVAFMPAIGVVALVAIWWDRRAFTNLGWSALVALVVAGPWWFRSRGEVTSYLFRYGYGDREQDFGTRSGLDRLHERLGHAPVDLRWPFLLLGAVALAATAIVVLVQWRTHGVSGRWREAGRGFAVLGIVLVGGSAALLSTSNEGVWFELPLELVAVTLTVAVVGVAGGAVARTAGVAAVALSTLTLVVSLTSSGSVAPTGGSTVGGRLFGGADRQVEVLGQADPRLRSPDPRIRSASADEWWAVNEELVGQIEDYRATHGRLTATVSGSSHLLNSQSLLLADELDSTEPPWIRVADTTAPEAELLESIEPRWNGLDRVLVLMEPESLPFPEDRQVPRLRAMADAEGWEVAHLTPLPDGGTAVIMTHPANG